MDPMLHRKVRRARRHGKVKVHGAMFAHDVYESLNRNSRTNWTQEPAKKENWYIIKIKDT